VPPNTGSGEAVSEYDIEIQEWDGVAVIGTVVYTNTVASTVPR
jgi:hypothetical protein